MSEKERNREELEHQAMEAAAAQEKKEEYVERPIGHRILAWVLIGVVIVGVIFSYCWISGIFH